MDIKLKLDSSKILNKEFPGATRGYDALAVDQYLDSIISDYRLIEANLVVDTNTIKELKDKIALLEEEKSKLILENTKMKARLGDIKPDEVVTTDNIELIKKLRALEKFIYDNNLNPSDAFK